MALVILTFIGFCRPSNFPLFNFLKKWHRFWFLTWCIPHIPPWVPCPVCCPCTDSSLQGFPIHCSPKPSRHSVHTQRLAMDKCRMSSPGLGWVIPDFCSPSAHTAPDAGRTLLLPWGVPQSLGWSGEANIAVLRAACCGQKGKVIKATVLLEPTQCTKKDLVMLTKCRFHSHLWMTPCKVMPVTFCVASPDRWLFAKPTHLVPPTPSATWGSGYPTTSAAVTGASQNRKPFMALPHWGMVDVWLCTMLHLHPGTCSA